MLLLLTIDITLPQKLLPYCARMVEQWNMQFTKFESMKDG